MSASGTRRLLELSEDERRVLRERAQRAAARPAQADEGATLDVLEIRSHQQAFALPLDAVAAIVELTSIAPLPRAPPLFRGLVSVRGEVLLGVELASLVGGTSLGLTDLKRVVAVTDGARKLAVLAERILSVQRLPSAAFVPDTLAQLPFVVGQHESFLSLLDPKALIDHAFSSLGRTSG